MENYQLIKQIGHGTYGEVWLVKCSKTRKKHVLKRIDLHQIPKREQRAAHLEAKLLSTFKHPNIVAYLDSFHNSTGSLFIVMSYCECGDLYDYIKSQNGVCFEEKLIVQWFVQICLALKYLHDQHILHRNLKTRNIFLIKHQVIKIGNIGVSKTLNTTQEMSASLIETPYYISPENVAGAPLSQKSDVWALGCCIYEVAALRHPYIARDSHSLLKKIKKKLPPLPHIYSTQLYDIILSMLNPLPEKRPCVTKLLLNSYIRKYILLILQGNSKSRCDHYSESSSTLSSGRSKSSSDLTPRLHDHLNGYLERSTSTHLLPNNHLKKAKHSSESSRSKSNHSKASIILVPDVNGNADGNDNSQHGLKYSYKNSLSPRTNSYKDGNSVEGSSQHSAKSENELKKNTFPQLKNFESRLKARQQKKRSELSLHILNNLTYTLNISRSDVLLDNGCGSAFEYAVLNSPKFTSFEKQPAVIDRNNLNNFEASKQQEQNNVCALPQIN